MQKQLGKPPGLGAFIRDFKNRKPSAGGGPFVDNWWEKFTGPNNAAESTVKKWLLKLSKRRDI